MKLPHNKLATGGHTMGLGTIGLATLALGLGACARHGVTDSVNPNQNTPTYTDLHPKVPLNQQPSHPGEITGRPETMMSDQGATNEAGTVPNPEPTTATNANTKPANDGVNESSKELAKDASKDGAKKRGNRAAKKPPVPAKNSDGHPVGNTSNGGSTGLSGSGVGTSPGTSTSQ